MLLRASCCVVCGTLYVTYPFLAKATCTQASDPQAIRHYADDTCDGALFPLSGQAQASIMAAYQLGGYEAAEELWAANFGRFFSCAKRAAARRKSG